MIIEVKRWFLALRPASLLISMMTVMVGNALAYQAGSFSWQTGILTILVTVVLQLITNLSNDLGDYLKGTDISEERLGPSRHLERQELTPKQIQNAIILLVISVVLIGAILLFHIVDILGWGMTLLFLLIGISAIIAAITYTLGKKPYGYAGWGDLSAFLFFGPIGVMGIYYLQIEELDGAPFLLAIAVGLLTTGILNVNNIRDIDNDEASGKITIAVRLGHQRSRLYHGLLNAAVLSCLILYGQLSQLSWIEQSYLLLTLPLFILMIEVCRRPSEALQSIFEGTVLCSFILVAGLTATLIWI